MNKIKYKECKRCKTVKPATPENFYRDKHTKDGLFLICKDCKKKEYQEKKADLKKKNVIIINPEGIEVGVIKNKESKNVKGLLHRPQSTEEIIGRCEVMAKLYEAWNDLTRLQNKTLNIFKEDWGMDRFRETLIDRAKEPLLQSRTLIENVMDLFKKDIEMLL